MDNFKTIIVEFGLQRKRFNLTKPSYSNKQLLCKIANEFKISFENEYQLNIYDPELNDFFELCDNDDGGELHLEDIEQFHRFKITLVDASDNGYSEYSSYDSCGSSYQSGYHGSSAQYPVSTSLLPVDSKTSQISNIHSTSSGASSSSTITNSESASSNSSSNILIYDSLHKTKSRLNSAALEIVSLASLIQSIETNCELLKKLVDNRDFNVHIPTKQSDESISTSNSQPIIVPILTENALKRHNNNNNAENSGVPEIMINGLSKMNLNNSFVKPPPGFSALSVRRSSPSIINDDEFIDSISTYQTAVNEVQQHTQRNIDSSVYLECKEELTITNQLQQQQQQPPLSK